MAVQYRLMMFQIRALPLSSFQHLFELADADLASRGALRRIATKKPGFPCRVSLSDAEIGEELILLHYEHQTADSPFRASHAIYVRRDAAEATPGTNEIPQMLRTRMLSLRGFDEHGMLLAAGLADGQHIEPAIEEMFRDPEIGYIHLHFAKPGCYAARVDRVK